MNGKLILTVDHSTSVRQLVCALLRDAGYEAVGAANGEEALTKAQDLKADLVVTGMHLRDIDGAHLIRRLRAQPNYQDTPILVLTSETSATVQAECAAAGASLWLNKPCEPRRLLDAVNDALAWGGLQPASH
jgi:two-component system chemotaxis response regulator CheY